MKPINVLPYLKVFVVFTLILGFFVSPISAQTQNRRALLVGISDYGNPHQDAGRWRNIHGANDIHLLYPILKNQQFQIDSLTNGRATHDAIIKSLNELIEQSKSDDIVYLHFSTHGQVVEDLNQDEEDGWDEAIIPYDAKQKPSSTYKGENHLIDDDLETYVTKLRKKVGPKGHVYIAIDACHAGTQSRDGDDENPIRGIYTPFKFDQSKTYKPDRSKIKKCFRLTSGKGESPVTYLEACQSFQLNKEIKDKRTGRYHGPLSLYIAKVISQSPITEDPSWTEEVRKAMSSDANLRFQHMEIEKSY